MPTTSLWSVGGQQSTWGVAVQGRYAYISTASSANGLQVYDISNPSAAPVLFGSATTSSSTSKRIKVQGKYAYVASAGVS